MSFLPFVGFHFVLAALLALCMRVSILASAFGTVVGNPWTFPLIWVSTYRVGRWLGFGGPGAAEHIDFGHVLGRAADAVWALDLPHLADAVWPVVKPMIVGGLLIGAVAWVAFYLLLRPILAAYKERRNRSLERGQAKAKADRAERMRLEKMETS